jgi:uncharacterized protein
MTLWLGLLAGTAFGFILQRSGALDYDEILKTLRLLDLKIAKFMFFSIAVGAAGIFTLQALGIGAIVNLPFYPGVLVGGLIFGVGFALSGYCPGTAIGAVAEGKRDAAFVVLGALAGTFAYALAHSTLKPLLIDRSAWGPINFAGFGLLPPLAAALLFGVVITALLLLLDRVFPGREDFR